MLSVIDVVLPVFGLIILGYYLGKNDYFSPSGIKDIIKFIFFLAMPALVFRTGATQFNLESVELSVLILYFGSIGLLFFLSLLIAKLLIKLDFNESLILSSSSTYSNLVLIGLPIVQFGFGEQGLIVLLTILSANALFLFVIPSAFIEIGAKPKSSFLSAMLLTGSSVSRNPLIISIVLGGLWGVSGYDLPYTIDRFTALLGQTASPLALFAVGASLSQYSIRGHILEASLVSAIKLVLAPLLVWFAGSNLFNLSHTWLAVATLCAGLPVAANVFVLSKRFEVGVSISSASIFLSTFLSMLSLSVLLIMLASH